LDYLFRQKTFQQTLDAKRLDGFVVTHPANLRYLCGYSGSNGLLLFLRGRRVFFTDGRYTEQARDEVRGARVVIAKGPLLEAASKLIGELKAAAIGFEERPHLRGNGSRDAQAGRQENLVEADLRPDYGPADDQGR
jgi:Xaa-Pro aminopeptidase